MFGRRTPKAVVRPAVPRPNVGNNCCVRTVPAQQPAQRPMPRPGQQRPNPFVKR